GVAVLVHVYLEQLARSVLDKVIQRLHEWLVGQSEPLVAPAGEDERTARMGFARDLADETGLTDAGLAGHKHSAATRLCRFTQRSGELLTLLATIGEHR